MTCVAQVGRSSHQMKLIEDWVECEYEGDLHTNMDDPYQYGPAHWYPHEKGRRPGRLQGRPSMDAG